MQGFCWSEADAIKKQEAHAAALRGGSKPEELRPVPKGGLTTTGMGGNWTAAGEQWVRQTKHDIITCRQLAQVKAKYPTLATIDAPQDS